MRNVILSFLIVLCVGFGLNVAAQSTDVGIRVNLAGGEVTSVSDGKIGLLTKDGPIEVVLSSTTEFKRIPPDNPKLSAAVASSLAEVGVGDKILVTGMVAADKKTIPAKAVYIITKSDIAQRQAKEQEEWRTRGISGRITNLNQQTREITITTPGIMGAKTTVISLKDNIKFLRYAEDSVTFNDAKSSNFEALNVGDTIRAVGDRSEDGATFKAEKILSGAFQTIAGTVTAINLEKGEITINNIQTKKEMVVVVGKNSVLKQFPAEMAQRLAMMQMGQGAGGGIRPPGQGNQQNPNQNPTQNPQAQGGNGMNRGNGSFDDMIDRFPTITIADLKVGDMIALSSAKTANADRVTAIKLLSGVEPFLRMPQGQGGGGRMGGGGVNSSFSIPGLDGAGIP